MRKITSPPGAPIHPPPPQRLADDHTAYFLGELEAIRQLLSNLPITKSTGQPASTCNFVLILSY